MSEPLTPEERIAALERELRAAHKEIAELTASLTTDLDMFDDDERWEEQALDLVERLTRALRQTTHVLAAHELGLTEAAIPERNEALLSEADAWLEQHQGNAEARRDALEG